MKKALVFLAILLLPLSAMAMSEITDSTLSDVTGQAGVSINPDFVLDVSLDAIAWGDKSGLESSTADSAGYIGIRNINLTGMTFSNQLGVAGVAFAPMTIDVATGGAHGDGVTFVRFGLGSLKITMPGQNLTFALGASPTNLNQTLGTAFINIKSLEFNPTSYVDIYGGSNCGVNIAFNISIKDLQLDTLSWGDTDGISGVTGSTGGYVGIANLTLTTANNPITQTGTVSINIGSNPAYTDAGTVLRVAFTGSDFVTNVAGPVTGDIMLDSARELNSSSAKSLGDIYVSSFRTTIHRNGYVDIWAH